MLLDESLNVGVSILAAVVSGFIVLPFPKILRGQKPKRGYE